MAQEMTAEQQSVLQQELALVQRLLALSGVDKHDTRFENEVALVADASAIDEADGLVRGAMSDPVKPAGEKLSSDFSPKGLVDAMGGVRGGQTLYVKTLDSGVSVYVAYWPWGGGARITIKIGVFTDDSG